MSRPHSIKRRSSAGFSIVELLVALATIGIISAIVVPQLIMAYERGRQRRSIADMRSVAIANGTYRVDFGEYAPTYSDLSPMFMNPVPPYDAWGTLWVYSGSGTSYSITSYGRDGAAGPAPPAPWYDDPYEPDLVLIDGSFTQVPSTR